MINVCVPTLNRYDLLDRLVDSLHAGACVPDMIYVVDNGRNGWIPNSTIPVTVHRPSRPMGVAESWNWFIDHVSGERIISNDDMTFGRETLASMVNAKACFVSVGFGFACFLLRDECVQRVGRFDETISPGYAYFEDRDYYNRMKLAGIVDEVVECGAVHSHSQTIASFSNEEMQEHHRRFIVAQTNFLAKWGKLPDDLTEQG